MFKKIQMRFISVLMAVLLLVFCVSSAFAAAPLSLHIEVDEVFSQEGETFHASGPAVDKGLVCATGTQDQLSLVAHGGQNPNILILDVAKHFTCGDGSGSFDIKMVVQLDNTTLDTTARWRIVGGTGDYVKLRGEGSLIGTPIDSDSIHDVYDGKVH
jgi:hypothetical protein